MLQLTALCEAVAPFGQARVPDRGAYIPSYCPHLDPIERLWGLMHRHVTHNRSHPSYDDFCRSGLHFLRVEVPKNWAVFCNSVTDNFRVINPADFRVLKA